MTKKEKIAYAKTFCAALRELVLGFREVEPFTHEGMPVEEMVRMVQNDCELVSKFNTYLITRLTECLDFGAESNEPPRSEYLH